MITTDHIHILYAVVMLPITHGGLAAIAFGVMRMSGDAVMSTNVAGVITIGVLLLTAGNIPWRITREGWIVIFSIHETLVSVERRLSAAEAYTKAVFDRLRATEENNDDRHEELLSALRQPGAARTGARPSA
ncbi:MAG TPA: hypothetical protein VF064_10080 [Pyrinomonadaceae bacterium]